MFKYFFILISLILILNKAAALTDGGDILYGVKANPGSTQDWGTVAPSTGTFSSITQLSPTGLGWPLGDIGSEPDPINGYVYTRQTNTSSGETDILAIKKVDGSTQWLGIGSNSTVVGYDTKDNNLIYRVSESSTNTLKKYNISTTTSETIGTFGGSNTSWQAGGIGVVDSFGRTAFNLRSSTLYKINLDDGTEETLSVDSSLTAISWDSLNQKLYGLNNVSLGRFDLVEISTSDGTFTNISNGSVVDSLSNYVQLIAPNDQRYYIQDSSSIIVVSLSDGEVLGSFSAPLRLMPVGAVVLGSNSDDETITFDIEDPSSTLIKLGTNEVNITGNSESSGATSILVGTLRINGEHDESTATISSGATLGGSGTVGGIVSNGNLEPGNSIGTLNISGDVTLNSGSVLVIEIDTAGNNDKIIATGDVTAGGTLRISPASGSYSQGQEYTIITGSSISGTFSTVTVLSCSGTASPTYGSTSITFTLSNCSFSAPKNREKISSYINDLSSGASGDLNTVITALNTLSGDTYNNALESLDYNTSGASSLLTNQQFGYINSMINQRIGLMGNQPSQVLNKVNLQTSLSKNDSLKNLPFEKKLQFIGADGWWIRGFGGSGEKESLTDLGVNGFDYDFIGTTIGFDNDTSKSKSGWALTTTSGAIDSFSSEGKTKQKSFALSRYLSNELPNGSQQNYSASLGFNDIESKRYLKFASIDRTAAADYKSYALDLNYQLSYPKITALNFEHNVDFDTGFSYIYQDGFTETGANSLNLQVDSNNSKILRIGVNDTVILKQIDTLTPYVKLGLSGTHIIDNAEINQKLVNQTSKLVTDSDRKTDLYADIGFGFVDAVDDNTEISLGINSRFSDKLTEYSIDATYHLKF